MLYTILCYNDEAVTSAWTAEEDAAVIARLRTVHAKQADRFKAIARLMPTSAASSRRNCVRQGPRREGLHTLTPPAHP